MKGKETHNESDCFYRIRLSRCPATQRNSQADPKENEILVRVHATPVNYGDLTARDFPHSQFNMPAPLYLPARLAFGWNKPKINILGSELAGDVEAVGSQ